MLLDGISSGLWGDDDSGLLSEEGRPLVVTDESPRKAFFRKVKRHSGVEVRNSSNSKRLRMRAGIVRGNSFAGNWSGQRVVIKINPVQNRTKGVGFGAGSGAKNLYQHIRYISREGAGKEDTKALVFDNEKDGVDTQEFFELCKDDRHHFRMIISPENGHQIDDFNGYVRNVMGMMEVDLNTPINWIAAVHYDTDDTHAHVIIRGANELGTDLVIGRDYIASGIRARAQEIATELLGERSLEEIQKSQEKQIEALSVTSLDKFIEKNLSKGLEVNVQKENNFGKDRFYEGLIKGRLQFLSMAGLATEYPPGIYTLRENYIEVLRESAQRQNILNNLYNRKPEMDLSNLSFYSMKAGEGEIVHGLVVDKGPIDEITDRKYLLVKDMKETLHYVPFGDIKEYDNLRQGSLIEITPGDVSSGKADFNIAQIAKANNGIYDKQHHMAYIEAELKHIEAENREGYLASHAKRLETLKQNKIVIALDDGRYEVPDDVVELGAEITRIINAREKKRFYPKLEVISALPPQKQIEAEKRTWLDKELYKQKIGKPSFDNYNLEIDDALQKRRDWLVEKDLGSIDERGEFNLKDGALRQLDIMELYNVGNKLADDFNLKYEAKILMTEKPYSYLGCARLETGVWAVVREKDAISMARIKDVPKTEAGRHVIFKDAGNGYAEMREYDILKQREITVDKNPNKNKDKELDKDMEL